MRTFWLIGKESSDTESSPRSPPTVPEESLSFLHQPSFKDHINEGCEGFIRSLRSPGMNGSSLSLYSPFNRNESERMNGYRSAPIISLKEFYSPSDL